MKYLQICVDLQLNQEAKDGLHQYRNLSQQVAPGSLEKVLKYLLELAEVKTREAIVQAEVMRSNIVQDDASAENVIMAMTSHDSDADRVQHDVVLPWLRFHWEVHRMVLEILSNNATLHVFYHYVADQTFKFCVEYKRYSEFRKLCDFIRKHLSTIRHVNSLPQDQLKPWQRSNAVQFDESVAEMQLETRFKQLDAAAKLGKWEESFKTIDDVHDIFEMAGTAPRPVLMATFYSKITTVLWHSKSYLFHAYSLWSLFKISRKFKLDISSDQLSALASRVILAALAIPVIDQSISIVGIDQSSYQEQKMKRVAVLLNITTSPSREALIAELLKKGVHLLAVPELHEIMVQLEGGGAIIGAAVPDAPIDGGSNLLRLIGHVKPTLDFVAAHSELAQYTRSLRDLIVVRLLGQLAQVYETIRINYFLDLVQRLQPAAAVAAATKTLDDAPANAAACPPLTLYEIEKIVVRAVRSRQFDVRIDHREHVFRFSHSGLEHQSMSMQLARLSTRLQRVQLALVGSNFAAEAATAAAKASGGSSSSRLQRLFERARREDGASRTKALERMRWIERRKEDAARSAELKKREVSKVNREARKKRAAEETSRMEKERRERESQKKKIEKKKKENKVKRDMAEKFIEGGGTADEIKIEDASIEQIENLVREKEEKEVIKKSKERQVRVWKRWRERERERGKLSVVACAAALDAFTHHEFPSASRSLPSTNRTPLSVLITTFVRAARPKSRSCSASSGLRSRPRRASCCSALRTLRPHRRSSGKWRRR